MPFRCVAITTCADKTKPPPDYVIPSERSESRNLPKWQILPYVGTILPRGGFLHSANAQGLNDKTGGRFYEFAYCFWNVSGCPAASSVRATPCQLPRRGSSCTVFWGAGVCRGQFRPFRCGTAHKPFPTVSLVGGRFHPGGF